MEHFSGARRFITHLFPLSLLVLAVVANAQQTCTGWRLSSVSYEPHAFTEEGTDRQAVCEAFAQAFTAHRNAVHNTSLDYVYVFRVQSGSVDGYTVLNDSPACDWKEEYRLIDSSTWNLNGWRTIPFLNLGATECPAPSNDTLKKDKNLGSQCNNTDAPVNVATGNKYQEEIDYVGSGAFPLRFVRHYNSHLWYGVSAPPTNNGEFRSRIGTNWRSNYDAFIRYSTAGSVPIAYAYRPDGRLLKFSLSGSVFTPDADISDRLTKLTDGSGNLTGWTYLVAARDELETYSAAGKLVSIMTRSGLSQTLAYDGSGRLSTVTDDFGRTLTFAYDSNGRLSTLTNPSSGVYTYAYNSVGNVSSVTHPDSTVRTYVYGETGTAYSLSGIIDENSARYSTYEYDNSHPKFVTSTEFASGANQRDFTYGSGGTSSTLTDALGITRTYTYSSVNNIAKNTSISQPCSSGCGGGGAAAMTYDANGNMASREDFNGNLTCYAYDLTRNLETVRVEGFAPSSTCPSNLTSYTPASGTRQRKISTTWHSTFNLPTEIEEPNRTTTYTYDSSGNMLTRTVTDTLIFINAPRTWTYTYNSFGQVLTENGPRTDVTDTTTYTYYGTSAVCTATVTGATTTGCRGQLNTITNALSHITTISEYNAHGQPLKITDANGLVTTLAYDVRQRLTSRDVGGETTTFTYWPTGLLKKVTLPDSSYLQYTYDNAHRLTRIDDSEGNYIVYTLDAMGNRTKEETFDPSSYLVRQHHRAFNSLNRLWKEIGSANTSNVTTIFGYDDNGNQTSINAPLSRNSSNIYDELNRLTQITDPASGTTQFAYDGSDNLSSVTDPRSLVTTYQYNGFGDQTSQTSPDTGTTTSTYDSGGNLASRTDARSKTGTYTYDALNRLTSLVYSDQTISYTYDTGTNSKGRLMQVSDGSGSTSWTYTSQGRVASKTQVVGSITKSISYAYNSAGEMTTLTTPSGQAVTYSYADGRVSGITVNSTTLLDDVIYSPFGPATQWEWGNSTLAVRTFDLDGNVTQVDSAGLSTYAYDDAFRIEGVTDISGSTLSWTYEYDALDRLTVFDHPYATNWTWSYNANGNRLALDTDTIDVTFGVSSSSNRLQSMDFGAPVTLNYDAAGNTTGFSYLGINIQEFAYDDAGRMTSSTASSASSQYRYNAMNQRVRKITPTATVHFMYDEAGRLVGEYDGSGGLIQETIWLDDIPVATVKPNGSGVSLYYIHTDQLNTPRKISRPSDNAVVWQWDSEPFGGSAAEEDPDMDSTLFGYNLRFPGQYFDAESNLHYNHHRYYFPSTGAYLQSDPIGLAGGINTYAYVGNNPIMFVDPKGLVRWKGTGVTYGAIIGGGGVFGIYDLYSECVNGRRVNARVHVAGSAVGFGLIASGTGGEIELEDGLDTPDYRSLEGSYKAVWGSVAWGGGYSLGAVQIGEARALPARGPIGGIDFSVGGTAGRAWVVEHHEIDCCSK